MVDKVRPGAFIQFDGGEDGRDCKYVAKYICPKCGKPLYEGQMACEECGTFFDWSKRAHIVVTRSVEWR